jgi:hypothetical protein
MINISKFVACRAATPMAQGLFITGCVAFLLLGGSVDVLTLVLSILAITLTQMVLASQDSITKAEHAKLDAIIEGTDADDSLRGIERDDNE